MAATDEDALVCDLAETYGIYDFRSLPLLSAATFAQGLGADARIMRRLSGMEAAQNTLLLATLTDRVGQLVWMLSEDGRKGKNRPKSILDLLLRRGTGTETAGYDSGADFDAAWKQLTEEAGHGD